jgi:hypothetical protein
MDEAEVTDEQFDSARTATRHGDRVHPIDVDYPFAFKPAKTCVFLRRSYATSFRSGGKVALN